MLTNVAPAALDPLRIPNQLHISPAIPELVVIGHVARDYVHNEQRLGGAAAFAACAAACLGVDTGVVTAAPENFDLLQPLSLDERISLVQINSQIETAFALDYSGPVRQIHLRGRACDIAAADIPEHFCDAPVAYIAPVIGECGGEVIARLRSNHIVVGAQGWLRTTNSAGLLVPTIATEALEPPPGISVVVFSELDHPEAESLAQRLAQSVGVVALTRGSKGVTLYEKSNTTHVAAFPADEVDPTGAGDVFGIVFGLALHRGMTPVAAARAAARAAASVVEGPGLGNLSEFARHWHL